MSPSTLTVRFSNPGRATTARRTPNQTGQGSHRFSAMLTADFPADVDATWQGVIHVYQCTPDGADFPRFETAVYRNGRMLPESNLPHLRLAAVRLYCLAFPDCMPRDFHPDADQFDAWAAKRAGIAAGTVSAPYTLPAAPAPVTRPRTIDMTPTWSGLMPGLLAALVNGTDTGRQIAREELTRLATIVDAQIAADKVAAAVKANAESEAYRDAGPMLGGDKDSLTRLLWAYVSDADVTLSGLAFFRTVAGRIMADLPPALPSTGDVYPVTVTGKAAEHVAAAVAELERLHGGQNLLWDSVTANLKTLLPDPTAALAAIESAYAANTLPDCFRDGHQPDATGRNCRACGQSL